MKCKIIFFFYFDVNQGVPKKPKLGYLYDADRNEVTFSQKNLTYFSKYACRLQCKHNFRIAMNFIIYQKVYVLNLISKIYLFSREPETRPPPAVSSMFTLLCLSPVLILLGLWFKLGVNIGNFPFSIASLGKCNTVGK